jgi:hypothetical protein
VYADVLNFSTLMYNIKDKDMAKTVIATVNNLAYKELKVSFNSIFIVLSPRHFSYL